MKLRILLLAMLLLPALIFAKDTNYEKKAKRLMKKMGLEQYEMYYTSKKELLGKYGTKDNELSFPKVHVYDKSKKKVMAQYSSGVKADILDCMAAFGRDLNRYMNDTGGIKYVTVDETLGDDLPLIHNVYNTPRPDGAEMTLLIYYPQGVPVGRKGHKELIDRVKYYRSKGYKIDLYFVIVPLL